MRPVRAIGAAVVVLGGSGRVWATDPAPYLTDPGARMLLAQTTQAPQPAGAQELRAPESFGTERRFLRATGEMVAVNLIMNLYGRYLMKEGKEGFIVTGESIKENLWAGMNWDDNTFSANNFRHPYQGGMYFTAGRANGYGFWESSVFSFAGSWMWEYMGEKHNPSFNDFANTGLGGMILGEATYRLAGLITDNTASGSGRAWRELGGFILSPVRGFNRLVTGEASTVHANPADRVPEKWKGAARFGMRSIGDEHLFDGSDTKLFVAIDGEYGSPFEKIESPFDHFDIGMQLNFDDTPHGIGRIEAQGVLFGTEVSRSKRTRHVLAAYQHFDYLDNSAYTFGGQSFGASFVSQFGIGSEVGTRTALETNAIVLGATKSDYFNISGREYDYGPGAAVKVTAVFSRDTRDVLTLEHDSYYIHSVNGGAVDSWDSISRAKFDIPFREFFGLGIEYVLYHSERDYSGQPRVSKSHPEVRAALSWSLR
jgi:hypothetical protein